MAFISKNLKFLRDHEQLTQRQLAEKLGLKQAAIGAYEEERALPPLTCLTELSKIFGVSIDNLVGRDVSKIPQKDWKGPSAKGKEVLAISVDATGRENVELVSQKASAGYLSGYQDPDFVKDLPKISLPVLPRNRTYRAFEIQGDSMLPIQPGSIIFGEYIENVSAIKNGKLYILVTKSEGIVFKRVFNFADKESKLLLVSDNRLYEPFTVHAAEVMEVWQAKGFYSSQFPEEKETGSSGLAEQLALQLLQLQSKKR